MTLAIVTTDMDLSEWVACIRQEAPDVDIREWPDVGDPDKVEFALAYKPPRGVLASYPNLKGIACMGVGVDGILSDPDFPAHVPLARIVDRDMTDFMVEYIVLAVLSHCRDFVAYIRDSAEGRWEPRTPLLARDTPVGIMGMGQLGSHAAARLKAFGFPVSGWSRTPKNEPGITAYAGPDELKPFLSRSRILICLLPLTPQTQGILNRETFSHLPPKAYLINAARGVHLVDADLLEAIDSGQLAGACLDVFHSEPLPADHPFWNHPAIILTPHIASLSLPKVLTPQLIQNYRRAMSGKPMKNLVDLQRGY